MNLTMTDLERVDSIDRVASRRIGNELAFTFPEVAEVIKRCTESQIAVLGVEILQLCSTGYVTRNLTDYDQQMGSGPKQQTEWSDYVNANNLAADEFVKLHPADQDHVYVLTAVSWSEFQQMN